MLGEYRYNGEQINCFWGLHLAHRPYIWHPTLEVSFLWCSCHLAAHILHFPSIQGSCQSNLRQHCIFRSMFKAPRYTSKQCSGHMQWAHWTCVKMVCYLWLWCTRFYQTRAGLHRDKHQRLTQNTHTLVGWAVAHENKSKGRQNDWYGYLRRKTN